MALLAEDLALARDEFFLSLVLLQFLLASYRVMAARPYTPFS